MGMLISMLSIIVITPFALYLIWFDKTVGKLIDKNNDRKERLMIEIREFNNLDRIIEREKIRW